MLSLIEHLIGEASYLIIVSPAFIIAWYMIYWIVRRPIPPGATRACAIWMLCSVISYFAAIFMLLFVLPPQMFGDHPLYIFGLPVPILLFVTVWLAIVPILIYKSIRELACERK